MNYVVGNYSKQKKVCFVIILFAFIFLNAALSADDSSTMQISEAKSLIEKRIKELTKKVENDIPSRRKTIESFLEKNRKSSEENANDQSRANLLADEKKYLEKEKLLVSKNEKDIQNELFELRSCSHSVKNV